MCYSNKFCIIKLKFQSNSLNILLHRLHILNYFKLIIINLIHKSFDSRIFDIFDNLLMILCLLKIRILNKCNKSAYLSYLEILELYCYFEYETQKL